MNHGQLRYVEICFCFCLFAWLRMWGKRKQLEKAFAEVRKYSKVPERNGSFHKPERSISIFLQDVHETSLAQFRVFSECAQAGTMQLDSKLCTCHKLSPCIAVRLHSRFESQNFVICEASVKPQCSLQASSALASTMEPQKRPCRPCKRSSRSPTAMDSNSALTLSAFTQHSGVPKYLQRLYLLHSLHPEKIRINK